MTPPPATPDAVRGGNGKITRELVLATALELIDRDGADALSMRRLGAALGRDPMILYRHAPDKAALLDGVVEAVLARLKVDAADPDWTAQLRTVARDYRALALAHPNVVPLLVTRPLSTPLALRPRGTLRPLEDVLELLTRAGFSGPDALHIYRALFGFLNGHVLTSCKNWSRTRTRPTTCCGWACTGCRSANSHSCAASPTPWPATTAPPNSNAASTSC